MRAAIVLTGLTLLCLTFVAPAQANPSPSPYCGKVKTDCHNPCEVTEKTADLVHRLPCFVVTFKDRCDKTVIVTLGNTAPGSVAEYVIDKKAYEVKGGSTTPVTVTPVKGYVVVTAYGHAPWKHKWAPVCVSQTPAPTGGPTGPAATPTLPVTGPPMPLVIGAGVLLLGAGVGLVVALRRRRVRFTA